VAIGTSAETMIHEVVRFSQALSLAARASGSGLSEGGVVVAVTPR
jgi:hypothetical protein